jgi:DNA invertase Pin-like site-specific DNA recombinase
LIAGVVADDLLIRHKGVTPAVAALPGRSDLFLHQQGVYTTTPAGKALFQMMGVFAEFERAMIQERVKAGLQRAKAQGKVLGRPSTQLEKVEAIKAGLRAGSVGIIKLAKLHGVGVGTVQRIKAALTA